MCVFKRLPDYAVRDLEVNIALSSAKALFGQDNLDLNHEFHVGVSCELITKMSSSSSSSSL
jgi:hypothetical protein